MKELSWEICVPIFKNSLIIKQLGLAIGIPFGLLTIILLLTMAYYALILIAALFILTFVLVMFVFGGTYDLKYVLSESGVLCQNQQKQKKRVHIMAALGSIFGIISGSLSTAGASMLSGSRTDIKIPWKRIRKIKCNEKQKTILLFAGFGENIAVFCTNENFEEVYKYIIDRMPL